jgi:DNA end-binding protein Ku
MKRRWSTSSTKSAPASRSRRRIAPAGGNVVDLMEALRRSVGAAEPAKPSKKPRKAASGQKEMLMQIEGKKAGKQAAAKKTASKLQRKSA